MTVVASDENARLRTRIRWGYGGLTIGIGLGCAQTAANVARSGYQVLPFDFLWNLIWAPFLGVVIGLALSRTRTETPRKWKRPQLRVQTLMVIVAYLAILLGGGITTSRMGFPARRYFQKSIDSAEMARVFRKQAKFYDTDAKLRRANVVELRAGKIPVDLFQGQREFLQSLEDDPKVTPDHRAYRRGLITETQEMHGIDQEQAVAVCGRIADHFEKLVDKYEWYRWHPWLPVEPDPPVPDQ